jgi:hypothetical protein
VKDTLENRLKVLVCDGRLVSCVPQQAIATNWYVAYQAMSPVTEHGFVTLAQWRVHEYGDA